MTRLITKGAFLPTLCCRGIIMIITAEYEETATIKYIVSGNPVLASEEYIHRLDSWDLYILETMSTLWNDNRKIWNKHAPENVIENEETAIL